MNTPGSDYQAARERYGEWGVETGAALAQLGQLAISLPCWQGDDVVGFEGRAGLEGAGILATGGYPGAPAMPKSCAATWSWPAG